MTDAEFTDQTRDDLRRLIAESDAAECDLTDEDIDHIIGLFETWFQRNMTTIPDELWRDVVSTLISQGTLVTSGNRVLLDKIRELDPTIFEQLGSGR